MFAIQIRWCRQKELAKLSFVIQEIPNLCLRKNGFALSGQLIT
jgi:hypothetical protein